MISNERGVIFPFTFCILILATVFISIHLQQYLAEKRFLVEVEKNLDKEYYFISAIKEVELLLNSEEINDTAGSISYSQGNIDYKIIPVTSKLLQITFKMQLYDYPRRTGTAYYDKDLKKMIKWVENNS